MLYAASFRALDFTASHFKTSWSLQIRTEPEVIRRSLSISRLREYTSGVCATLAAWRIQHLRLMWADVFATKALFRKQSSCFGLQSLLQSPTWCMSSANMLICDFPGVHWITRGAFNIYYQILLKRIYLEELEAQHIYVPNLWRTMKKGIQVKPSLARHSFCAMRTSLPNACIICIQQTKTQQGAWPRLLWELINAV